MGRGATSFFNALDHAFSGNCHWCGNKIKRKYWYNDTFPELEFCKKSCLNNYVKKDAKEKDKGCSLCGKRNPSLRYYINEKNSIVEQYCTIKHARIAETNPIILDIKYNLN